jgi:hypothetical protein
MCWRKWLTRSISNTAVRQGPRVLVSLLLLVACSPLRAADRVKDLQDHFDKETHASAKIKALEKLSEAQFDAASKAGQQDDFLAVGLTMEKYRDNAMTAFELLRKQEPDADHHPNGYRQLELQVRRGIREVEETLLTVPDVVRPPLRIVRQDLIDLDDTLIRALFPRRTPEPQKVPPVPESKP